MIDLYTRRSEKIKHFFKRCNELRDALDHLREHWKPTINNDVLLTDAEVAERLRVTRRTLHDYRDNGMIPYYIIGGKCLYSENDLNKLLMSCYRPSTM